MKKYLFIFIISVFVLVGYIIYQRIKFFDHKLHIVFCDVGQGDGIIIRTSQGKHILIDGGLDDKILRCLSSHLPFWERKIDLVFLTHPHADHLQGLISVLNRYTVISFNTENLVNKTEGFRQLMITIQNKNIPLRYVFAGDEFTINDGLDLKVIAPDKEFLEKSSPNGLIAETKEFASLEILLSFHSFQSLFTGDSQLEELENGVSDFNLGKLNILQVPHHGSKSGINRELLNKLMPEVTVISVGKNNKYGHPSIETLRLLDQNNTKILRTDQRGDVEIISDGKSWWISGIK